MVVTTGRVVWTVQLLRLALWLALLVAGASVAEMRTRDYWFAVAWATLSTSLCGITVRKAERDAARDAAVDVERIRLEEWGRQIRGGN